MYQQKTITIPAQVLERMHDAFEAWSEAESTLEDFVCSQDTVFLHKLKRARKEHSAGKLKSLRELKKKLMPVSY